MKVENMKWLPRGYNVILDKYENILHYTIPSYWIFLLFSFSPVPSYYKFHLCYCIVYPSMSIATEFALQTGIKKDYTISSCFGLCKCCLLLWLNTLFAAFITIKYLSVQHIICCLYYSKIPLSAADRKVLNQITFPWE